MTSSAAGVAVMLAMGLTTSVVAPGTLMVLRDRVPAVWAMTEPWSAMPPAPVLVWFLLWHGGITMGMAFVGGTLAQLGLWVALYLGGVVFYLPMLGAGSTMGGAGRSVYLFIAAPCLDLAAVLLMVVTGSQAEGLAMIVGMLPMGVAAMMVTWRWALEEEESAGAPRPLPGYGPGQA